MQKIPPELLILLLFYYYYFIKMNGALMRKQNLKLYYVTMKQILTNIYFIMYLLKHVYLFLKGNCCSVTKTSPSWIMHLHLVCHLRNVILK